MANKPWAVVLCKFSDQPQEPHPPAFYAQAFTEAGAGKGTEFDYWRDLSFGKLDLTGSKVFGWFAIPHKLTDIKGRRDTFVSWGTDAAVAHGVDLSAFLATIVIFNADVDSGAAGGSRIVLGTSGADWGPSFDCHEMGHIFGLDHSFGTSPTPCASGDGRPGAYCDRWDIMSFGNAHTFPQRFSANGPGLNAPNLDKLGCIPGARIWGPTNPNSSAQVTLAALGHPDASGFLMAKIPSNGSTFTIEFRRNDRWDAGFQRDTVLVHEIRADGLGYLMNSDTNPELLPGSEFIDPRGNFHVKIESFDSVAATATVTVRVGRSFERLGGVMIERPTTEAWGSDRLDIVVRGANNEVFHKIWDGNRWLPSPTDWEDLGGAILESPSIVSWLKRGNPQPGSTGPGRLDVFGQGVNGNLVHKAWDGSAWLPSKTDWEDLSGQIIGVPAVASWAPNRLDIFVRGTKNAVFHKAWNGSQWVPSTSDWEDLGGQILDSPAVASWGPGRLDIFVRGTNNHVFQKVWDGSRWLPSNSDWEDLGGAISATPEVVSWGPNRLDIFVRGSNGGVFHKAWDGSQWLPSKTGWEDLGGRIVGAPAAVSWGPNRLDIFVRGTNDGLFHKAWGGHRWLPSTTGWEDLGGQMNSTPSVTSWAPNRLDVIVHGKDGAAYHIAWDGFRWLPI